jgi:hypothetical protein
MSVAKNMLLSELIELLQEMADESDSGGDTPVRIVYSTIDEVWNMAVSGADASMSESVRRKSKR